MIGSAIVVDPLLGVVKADLGIKDGRIAGIGRAGNPDITDGVDLTIGPGTWPIPCHGLIATPGGIDSHVHLLSPRLVPVALSAGVTTLITAGFEEPAWRMHRTLEAFEFLPVNLGLQASARADRRAPLDALIEAGAVGLKIHEDWGAYPEIVDATLGRGRGPRRRGVPAHRRAERVDGARGHDRGDRRAARCTPTTSRARAAGTCPTCSASCACRTCSARRRRPACRGAGPPTSSTPT